MKIIRNSILPPKGYSAIYLFGLLFIHKDVIITDKLLRHERTHARQCWEMLGLFFYLWYCIEWVIRLLQYRNKKQAYRNISFEREAYSNQSNVNYLKERKRFDWVKYLRKNG